MENSRVFGAMREKRIGRGEDSDPILFIQSKNEDFVAVGVFDGMGGAGSVECLSDYSEEDNHKTKAYVASRIIRNAISNLLDATANLDTTANNEIRDFRIKLKDTILARYAEEKEKYPSKSKNSLRSSLIKDYPTTLALATVQIVEDKFLINSYWAGDSRNYLWTKDGFFQISKDDLKGDLDPLENLAEDAPMSNCLHADGFFKIQQISIDTLPSTEKIIIISATDGCFGYFPSPMDFERVLNSTLLSSQSLEEWERKLVEDFEAVTADDFSFGVATIGFKDFKDIKRSIAQLNKSSKVYFNKRKTWEWEIKKAERKVANLHKKIGQELLNSWSKYKADYLKYLETDE